MSNESATPTPISRLASGIERAGLAAPARLLLDVFAPLDVINAQIALFVIPFTRGSRWKEYASALSNEHEWEELRRILSRQS
jgi:hypothetical protein